MAEKDITEKMLVDYSDVFADIMNAFLFHGEQVVSPDDLETVKDKSQYKVDGKIHEQERDVTKRLKKNRTTVILAGIEHQTRAEKFMPLRQIGYDGQSYRAQLLDGNANRAYPVITIVLYFGARHWPYSHHLAELIDTPEEYRPFVSDYEMKNLFEVAFLKPEQIKLFHSDFRYVADYFVQTRISNDYHPDPDTIEHVDATLKMMSVLTGDYRFEGVIPELPKEGGVTMCAVLDRIESKGRKEGRSEGRKESLNEVAIRMIHAGKLSDAEIADYLGLEISRIEELREREETAIS